MSPITMFFFSSKNPDATAEDWYNRLRWFSNPRQLLKPLLSEERSFMEKAKILWAMPKESAEKTTDMRWLESKLDDAGHTQLAQILRFRLYQQQPEGKMKRDCMIWCRYVIEKLAGLSKERYMSRRKSTLCKRH